MFRSVKTKFSVHHTLHLTVFFLFLSETPLKVGDRVRWKVIYNAYKRTKELRNILADIQRTRVSGNRLTSKTRGRREEKLGYENSYNT